MFLQHNSRGEDSANIHGKLIAKQTRRTMQIPGIFATNNPEPNLNGCKRVPGLMRHSRYPFGGTKFNQTILKDWTKLNYPSEDGVY